MNHQEFTKGLKGVNTWWNQPVPWARHIDMLGFLGVSDTTLPVPSSLCGFVDTRDSKMADEQTKQVGHV